jgi:hypothetical protein
MAYFNLPFSIRISNDNPIDGDRYIANDIAARNQLVTDGRVHLGLQVYVVDEGKLYICKNLSPITWEQTGDIFKVDTPVNNQIGIWTGDGSIKGTSGLTFDGSLLSMSSDIQFIGNRDSKIESQTGIGTHVSGYNITIQGGTAYTGNNNGGNVYIYGGESSGSGNHGDIYFGTGLGGAKPLTGRTSETNIIYYDTNTGKISYGASSTPNSNILYWDSVNNYYTPYSIKGAGRFDNSTTDPSNSTRLNYDGHFHATKLYGQTEIFTGNGTGIFMHMSSYWIESMFSGTQRMILNPSVGDGSSAVAYMFDTNNALTTNGSKLFSIKNNGVEKFYIDNSGETYANGVHLTSGSTPTSDILYWNSTSNYYTPYSSQTNGKFDNSANNPTHSTNRLNFDGIFHASGIRSYGSTLVASTTFSTTPSATGIQCDSGSGSALQATTTNGVVILAAKSNASVNDNTPILRLSRSHVITGGFNTTGNIIEITDNPSTSGTISGSILKASISSTMIDMNPRVTDTSSNIAYLFNTLNNLTAGRKLLSVRNQGVEKFYIDYSGNTISNNTRIISKAVLTSGITTNWYMDISSNAEVTLGGNSTLSITNLISGDVGTLSIIQGGSGGYNLTLPANSKVANGGDGVITLSTGVGSTDLISFYYDGTYYYWNVGLNYN